MSRPSFRLLVPIATLAVVLAAPASAQWHRREQDAARAARLSGQAMPLREIEQRIVPRMPGCDYLGPEYDAGSGSYRLKFMRAGALIFVDVDARTGAVIGRSGD